MERLVTSSTIWAAYGRGKGNKMHRMLSQLAMGFIAAGIVAGSASAQAPGSLPDYLAGITGTTPQTPPALATRDVRRRRQNLSGKHHG
jgi:hypothetical protein